MLKRNWQSVSIGLSAVAIEACWAYALLSLMDERMTSWRIQLPLMIALPFVAYLASLLLRAYGKASLRFRYGLLAVFGKYDQRVDVQSAKEQTECEYK